MFLRSKSFVNRILKPRLNRQKWGARAIFLQAKRCGCRCVLLYKLWPKSFKIQQIDARDTEIEARTMGQNEGGQLKIPQNEAREMLISLNIHRPKLHIVE